MIELNLHSTDYRSLFLEGAAMKKLGYVSQTEKPYKAESKDKIYGWYFTKEI